MWSSSAIRQSLNLPLSVRVLMGMLLLLLLPSAGGCGDEEPIVEPLTFPENPGPITIDAAQRGLPLELNRSFSANASKFGIHQGDASSLFIYAQIRSEYVETTEGQTGDANFDDRIDNLYDTFDTEIALFQNHYLVVDLQRRDREWLVDWAGLERDEPENRPDSLNFTRRDDYWVDVQERLIAAVQRTQPFALVIGTEMNLYYDQNTDDWANFVEFYWTLYDAIKAEQPNIRVAAGINWSFFVENQIDGFTAEGEGVGSVEAFDRAYAEIIAPLMEREDGTRSDFAALAAIPDPLLYNNSPAELTDAHFAGMRRAYPEGTFDIVWFRLGWPVSSSASSAPGSFYERFLELAGGTTIERVNWWGLSHYLDGDCTPLTGATIGASQTVCFQGLFSVSGAPTALSNAYFSLEE